LKILDLRSNNINAHGEEYLSKILQELKSINRDINIFWD